MIKCGYHVIKCKDNVTVEGAGTDEENGTILKPVGQTDYSIDMFYFNDLSESDGQNATYLENADFKNFVIDGELAIGATYNSKGKGFMINLFRDCDWNNIIVKNTDGTGFGIDCPINSTITNCIAIGCGKGATTSDAGASGFGIGTGYSNDESLYISNCTAIGNRKYGFFFEHQNRFTSFYQATEAESFVVSNCEARGNLYDFGGERAYDLTYENCTSNVIQSTDSNPLNSINESAFNFGTNSVRIQTLNCKVNQNFIDVTDNSEEYYNPVYWALDNSIVSGGTNVSEFYPNDDCTNAMAITLLWRMAGRPGNVVGWGESIETGYTDVENNQWYTDAVKWGKETGILNTDTSTFGPSDTITRADMVTILWRYAGRPNTTTNNNFNDIESGSYYEDAVNWAVSEGIINSTDELFLPYESLTRGEAITWLYRIENPLDTQTPTINLNPSRNTTYQKSHVVNVIISDNVGLETGGSIRYGWSESREIEPFTYQTAQLNNSSGISTMTLRVTTTGLTGMYYLWIVPENIRDTAGNENIQTVVSSGAFYFDNDTPNIIDLEENGGTITGIARDADSGIIAYMFTRQTNITQNSAGWTNISATTNNIIETYTAEESGTYYFYVMDVAGNITSNSINVVIQELEEPEQPSDTIVPTINITIEEGENRVYKKSHTVTAIIADNVGLATGGSIKYGWSESTEIEPTSYRTVQLNNSEGVSSVTLELTTSGLTGEYYLWIVPENITDMSGNRTDNTIISTEPFYFDNTLPNIISLEESGGIIRGTAQDETSGIVAYMFTTDSNITAESEGWTEIEKTTEEIEETYTAEASGTYYFYVKDEAGNIISRSINVTIQGTDDPDDPDDPSNPGESEDTMSPTITLNPNENTTYSTAHSVNITIADEEGLAGNGSIRYGWSESRETEPTGYETMQLDNIEGATTATIEITGTDLTGEYYLWVIPENIEDISGNRTETATISTGMFYFDNQVPEIIEVTNDGTTIKGTAQDETSGIVAYMFATENNITAESEGWNEIEATTEVIEETYTVQTSGTYYFYVKDEAGNITSKSINVNTEENGENNNSSNNGNSNISNNSNNGKVDPTTSNTILPKAGIAKIIAVSIAIMVIIAGILYFKVRRMKDVK